MAANVASLTTSQLITWSLTLAWTLIVPRALGPGQMGILMIALSVTSVAAVVFGAPPREFLVREMVTGRSLAGNLLSTTLLVRVAVFPLILMSAYVYGRVAGLDSTAMTVMYLMACATLAAILIEPALCVFQAMERMQYIGYNDVAQKTMQTVVAILLAVAGFGAVAIAAGSLAVMLLALALALLWAHRMVGVWARPMRVWPVLRRGAPYWVVSLGFVSYLWADALILGMLVPAEVVGWYGTAMRLFMTMMFVAVIISTASLPRMIAAHAEGGPGLAEAARKPLEWVVIAGVAIGVGLAGVADEAVPILYGGEFLGAVWPLVILAACLPLMYVNIMVNQWFVAQGRPLMTAVLLGLAAVVNVGLNLLLIPWAQEGMGNGGVGAALALLVAEVLQLAAGMAIIGRRLIARGTLARILKALAAGAVMGGALIGMDGMFIGVQVVVGAAVFAGVSLALRLPNAQERTQARRLYEAVRRRAGAGRSTPTDGSGRAANTQPAGLEDK